jgi:uncharacterized protein (DUF1697 family)
VARQIALLRGINIGPRNRIAMPALRDVLERAGYQDAATYVQSGNVVLSAGSKPEQTKRNLERLIKGEFGLEVDVVVRTRSELARVVARNPLADVAAEPKRYQVTFLAAKLPAATVKKLEAAAADSERFVVDGREVYAWHPAGVARSKLWALLGGRGLGVTATSRNWTTVTALLELAGAV